MKSGNSLFRMRGGESGEKVEFIELFFDLVFVFAVTQLSHAQIAELSAGGMVRTALLMTAVWWVWVFTNWATNWFAPERIPVRLCLVVMMFAGPAWPAATHHLTLLQLGTCTTIILLLAAAWESVALRRPRSRQV